jgi:hypothetical protein
VTTREERGWVVINKAAFALPGFEGLGRCLRGERALFDGLYVVYRR